MRPKPSRARLGAIGGGIAVAVLGGSALVATLAGGDGGGFDRKPDKEPAGNDRPAGDPATPDTPPETTGPDPLCVLHDERVAALDAIGSVAGPTQLEAFVSAQRTFYAAAAAGAQEPAAGAFRSMSGYYDALRSFYEARAWQQATFSDAAQLPQVPADANARTSEALAERCGVQLPTDTPG